MFKRVAFTAYPVTEMAPARAFYEDVLGLPPSKAGEHSPWVEYDLPGGGCFAISNVLQRTPSASAGGMIALEVEDLDALVALLEAKGAEIAGKDIAGPHCRMAVVKDPDGNAIILHRLNSGA